MFNSNSDEHDERGYFSEDAPVVATLVDKRCRKYFTAAALIDGINTTATPRRVRCWLAGARRKARSLTPWISFEQRRR